jgi:hypothetical protein
LRLIGTGLVAPCALLVTLFVLGIVVDLEAEALAFRLLLDIIGFGTRTLRFRNR